MKTIRWGIIGCGDVAEVKSGPAFQQADGSELVAVMRRNGALARDFAQRHGVAKWCDNADSLIFDPDVDAVYVATPPGAHCDIALRVAASGKPAYVEKPMARTYAECQRMVTEFRNQAQPLFVAYYRRALPRFLKVKEIIEMGRLGDVTGLNYCYTEPLRDTDLTAIPWRYQAEASGGGLFFDLGSHVLDIMDFLFGSLEAVAGIASNQAAAYEVEDNVVMHFRTAAGVSGTASWNFAGDATTDRLTIVGTKGRLDCAVFGNDPVQLQINGQRESFELPHPRHIQQPLIQSIVDELLGRGECPSTGESGARTADVMDRVTENYYGSRALAFWDRLTTRQ